MRKIMSVVLFILILAAPLSSLSSGWEEESSWSYRWEYDFSENREEIESFYEGQFAYFNDTKFELKEATGGYVLLFSIEYAGKENGCDRFDYKGGMYSKYILDMSTEVKMEEDDYISEGNMSSERRMEVEELKIDFEGSLWMKEHDYRGYENRFDLGRCYGVVNQTLKTSGIKKMNTKSEYEMKDNSSETSSESTRNSNIEWDVESNLSYDPPLPWIPLSSETKGLMPEGVDVSVNCTGSVKGNRYMKMEGGSMDRKIDESVDEKLEESETVHVGLTSTGDDIRKPSPILCGITWGEQLITLKTDSSYYDFTDVIYSTIGETTEGKYSDEEEFYSDFYMSFLGYSSSCSGGSCSLPQENETICSQETTVDEVEEFREDKKNYFNQHLETSSNDRTDIWVYMIPLIIGVIFASMMVGYFIKKRRERRKFSDRPSTSPEHLYEDERYLNERSEDDK